MRMRWLVLGVLATGTILLPLTSGAGPHGAGLHGGRISQSSAVTRGRAFDDRASDGTIQTWNHRSWHYNHWNGRWFWFPGFVGFGAYQWGYPYWYDYPTTNVTVDYDTIEAVQSALAGRGYYRGVIDGVNGPQSRQAIEDFQADQGLPVTGQIDGKLLAALRLI